MYLSWSNTCPTLEEKINIEEFVKRTMKSLLDVVLTRQFNLTGQEGKQSFAKLLLFDILLCTSSLFMIFIFIISSIRFTVI